MPVVYQKEKVTKFGKKQKEAISKEYHAAIKQELTQLKSTQESEISRLKAKQEEDHLSVQALQLYAGPPVDLIMTEFKKHKQDDDTWYSEPFYTHPLGYKMCLRVDANGLYTSTFTHVTLFSCLMKGKFDDYLKWPFRGDITIQLINQLQDMNHHTAVIEFSRDNSRSSDVCTNRATTGEMGKINFLPHSMTQPGTSSSSKMTVSTLE